MAEPKGSSDYSSMDEVIERKEFERQGLDLSSFVLEEFKEKEEEEVVEVEVDDAIGSILDPFTLKESVEEAPDPRKSDAVEAEQKVNWSMMVAMVLLWSFIGTYVGMTMPAIIAGPALFIMAMFSLWLAKLWIPDNDMRVLGTTWAIIAMKLLYGLAIDLHHWEIIDSASLLGIVLLGLVGLNIYLAHYFDEDAIAAQATLVLMAIGSAAGAIYGELGVAAMIILATMILHLLAFLRKSGNLTALGIASSNIWIGLHALSSGWNVFGLVILPFEDPLILLLLMLFVNAANAAMAARFAREQNWFSQAASALGLGKPGLWGVSIGLGMMGALLAIAAHRDETGFALAQISILLTAFGASYLVVRGVSPNKVLPGVLIPIPFLVVGLVLFDTGVIGISLLSGHAVFAAGMGAVAANSLLKNQNAVSDAVMWISAVIGAILLTLLIPADEGQHGSFLLLAIALLFASLGGFAIKRSSPSLAGVSVLAPWLWILLFATDIENRMVAMDILPIVLNGDFLTIFMFSMGLLQVAVNMKMGETGVDLGKAFGSGTEALARIKDSGVLKLWQLGWLFALLSWLAVARPDGLPALGLVMGIVTLSAMHLSAQVAGRHVNQRKFMLTSLAVATLWLHWRFGLTLVWPLLLAFSGLILAWDASRRMEESEFSQKNRVEPLLSLTFTFIAAHLMISTLDLITVDLLAGTFWPDEDWTLWVGMLTVALCLIAYLPIAGKLSRPMGPAISCLLLLLMLSIWTNSLNGTAFLLTILMFSGSGLWLISQGEIRMGLISLAKVEEAKEMAEKGKLAAKVGLQGADLPEDADSKSGVRLIDANLVHKAAKQAKRRKRSGGIGEHDLVAGDVHHTPLIVLFFLATVTIAGMWWSYANGNGDAVLLLAMMLFIAAIFLGQSRARSLELRLSDVLGMEVSVAASMVGLVLVHLAARISPRHVNPDSQMGLLLLTIALAVLAWISLRSRKDLALRLPSALEWILYCLVGDRLLALILVGGIPAPFTTDPWNGELIEWITPWLGLELFLIGFLLLFDMIEKKRLERGLDDHRGADGRSLWASMVMVVSWGPATILAGVFSLLRARSWNQPGLAITAVILLSLGVIQSSVWIPLLSGFEGHIVLITGICCFGLLTKTVQTGNQRWTTAWLWNIHILLPIGALVISQGTDELTVVAMLAISGSAWITGVLEERRGWRVVGFLDLLAAWVVAGLALSTNTVTSALIMPMLLASVLLLGLVTWLGQRRKEALSID